MAKLINAVGLYTESQMEEKRKRIRELWEALNAAHAFMDTYALYTKSLTYDDSQCPKEMRMSAIREVMDLMADRAGRAEAVLNRYSEADWS